MLGERDASRRADFHGLIRRVTCLETGENVSFKRTEETLTFKAATKEDDMPKVFRITID